MHKVEGIKFTDGTSIDISYYRNSNNFRSIEVHTDGHETYCVESDWGPARIVFHYPFSRKFPDQLSNIITKLQSKLLHGMVNDKNCDLTEFLAVAQTQLWQQSVAELLSLNTFPSPKSIADITFLEVRWQKNEALHREDGPARILYGFDGSERRQEWLIQSEFHRFSGPAVIEHLHQRKRRKWYVYGQRITVNEIRDRTGITGPIPDKFSEADTVTLKMHYG